MGQKEIKFSEQWAAMTPEQRKLYVEVNGKLLAEVAKKAAKAMEEFSKAVERAERRERQNGRKNFN